MTRNRSTRGGGFGAQAYEVVRDMILTLEFPPGTPLGETELSTKLGVSRTPVREALGRLAREGLVRQYPGRGAFVSEISVPDVAELYQMREALECHAARLAAESVRDHDRDVLDKLLAELQQEREFLADGQSTRYYELMTKMDQTVVRLTGNKRLEVALSEVWAQISRVRRVASKSPTRLLDTVDEHVSIVTAIRDGDADEAAAQTRHHVRRSLANVTNALVNGIV